MGLMKHMGVGFVILVLTGCGVGTTGGPVSGRVHGYDAASRLEPGMSFEETQVVLAEGAGLYPPELYFRNADGNFVSEHGAHPNAIKYAVGEMKHLSEADKSRVQKIVSQSRGQGFFGFDEFLLFFDEEDTLVGHSMVHFN